jgi:16S rRNA (cytidine1402-2'-O)-methyltransferase
MADKAVALVSDAGTPLVSDPGYRLVREARAAGIAVTSLPGPSAPVTALTLSGLPSDRFLFAGFLPAKDKARGETLAELASVKATLVFFETAPRLVKALAAVGEALPGREIAVARELTKLYEECRTGTADELAAHYAAHPPRGEIVLLVGPPREQVADLGHADSLLLEALMTEKPSQAAALVARATGLDRKALYARALELKVSLVASEPSATGGAAKASPPGGCGCGAGGSLPVG